MQNLVFKWNGTSNKKLMRKDRSEKRHYRYKLQVFFFFCFFTNSHSTGA